MHLATRFEDIARAVPDKTALIHGNIHRSWGEFDDRAARIAAAFGAAGIGQGDCVAIDMYNAPEWLETFYAAIKCRARPANVNYRYREEELLYILRNSAAKAVVFHRRLAEAMFRIIPQLPADTLWIMVDDDSSEPAEIPATVHRYDALLNRHEPAPPIERPVSEGYLSYTGGTTGLPKGVLVNFDHVADAIPAWYDTMFGMKVSASESPGEIARRAYAEGCVIRALPAPPLMHSTGLGITALPTLSAGGVVVTLTSPSFNPHEMLAAIEAHRVNRLTIVGDVIARPTIKAIEEGRPGGGSYDLSSLRIISSAGIAWTASAKAALLERLPHVLMMESCGASEGVAYGSRISKAGDEIITGRFDPAPGLKMLNENGEVLPQEPGQSGLLAAPSMATGYLKDAQKSAEIYREIDGVLHATPGDYGRWEEDGTFTLLGRKSAVINTGGEKVHPDEVEDVIKQIAAVEDCLVFGIADETWGQSVAAVVQLRPGADTDQSAIIEFVKLNLAGYKAPKLVRFVSLVPRGPNGKGDYKEAAGMFDLHTTK